MFDGVGFGEWLVIAVVALLVVGPKDLPKLLKSLGQFTRKMRIMADEFKNNFEDIARHSEITELRKELDDLRKVNPINQIRDEISGAINQGSDYYHSKTDDTPAKAIEHIDDDYISAHNQAILANEKSETEIINTSENTDSIDAEAATQDMKSKEVVNDKSS